MNITQGRPPPPGEDSDIKLLSSLEQFQEALVSLAQRTRRELAVFSPSLDPLLYEQEDFEQALSLLARRHRLTRVRLLVRDSQPIAERGHMLLRLAQRLPSKIELRKLTNDIETRAISFVLGDRQELLYQNDMEQYRGFWDSNAAAQVKTLKETFDRAWNTAEEDPRLRQLLI